MKDGAAYSHAFSLFTMSTVLDLQVDFPPEENELFSEEIWPTVQVLRMMMIEEFRDYFKVPANQTIHDGWVGDDPREEEQRFIVSMYPAIKMNSDRITILRSLEIDKRTFRAVHKTLQWVVKWRRIDATEGLLGLARRLGVNLKEA